MDDLAGFPRYARRGPGQRLPGPRVRAGRQDRRNGPSGRISTTGRLAAYYNRAVEVQVPRCWKCSSTDVEAVKMRVGRVRTTAEQIQQGAEDLNTYQDFLVCQEKACGYRWFPHQDLYLREIVYRAERNAKIADLCGRLARAGHTVFVYVGLIEHAELLGLLVKGVLERVGVDPARCVVVHGKIDDKKNDEAKKALNDGRVLVAIGTSVWGEGTNIPRLRWVVNAKAGKPGIELKQLVGRMLRRPSGKFRAGYVDFLDQHSRTFAARSRARFNSLQAYGFKPAKLRLVASPRGQKYRR